MKELTIPVGPDREQVTAVYLPHEQRAMLEHAAAAERRGIPRAEIEREVEFLHVLKSTFEATLLP